MSRTPPPKALGWKLQPTMTVQSGEQGHYAHCVRCRWSSPQTSYERAKALAGMHGTHNCLRIKP